MKYRRIALFGLGAAAAALWSASGCSAVSRDRAFADDRGTGGAGGREFGGPGITSGGLDLPDGDGNSTVDADGDGFAPADGDCNDDDGNVNPGAIEVKITEPDQSGDVPEPADEDCDGTIDNVAIACDDDLALDDFDAMNGAKAIDLCAVATPADKKWGVLRARYVRGSGIAAQRSPAVGIFDSFGPNVRTQGGARMLALSSGHARIPSQDDACNLESCSTYGPGTAPSGFPQDNPSCAPSEDLISDDVGLELTIRAPTNATGYEFRFKFYTFEYPEWICDDYASWNDQFLALATPNPPGSFNGNLCFDSRGNPVSVNIGFFDVCSGPECTLGTAELQGTGFDSWNSAGGTGWLKTQAPVTGGEELTLLFLIFDTGDDQWDSTALVDGFRWIASGGTVAVGTAPVEEPR